MRQGPGANDDLAARRRVLTALAVLAAVLHGSATGYWLLGQADGVAWGFGDCLYMSVVTVSTVGFQDILNVDAVAGGRLWTVLVILLGSASNLWVVSSLTSFLVGGDFAQLRRYRRQRAAMDQLEGHTIVCGVGTTGSHVARDLLAAGTRVLVIDLNAEALEAFSGTPAIPLRGDATHDDVLAMAGLARARGIVSALDDDKTNMFVVVSARQANPAIRIVAKAVHQSSAVKLERAGADVVVSPNYIGGRRMASELLRPHVLRFVDALLEDREPGITLEEGVVGENSPLLGKTLAACDLRARTGALVIAVRGPAAEPVHVPETTDVLRAGQHVTFVGPPAAVLALRQLLAG